MVFGLCTSSWFILRGGRWLVIGMEGREGEGLLINIHAPGVCNCKEHCINCWI